MHCAIVSDKAEEGKEGEEELEHQQPRKGAGRLVTSKHTDVIYFGSPTWYWRTTTNHNHNNNNHQNNVAAAVDDEVDGHGIGEATAEEKEEEHGREQPTAAGADDGGAEHKLLHPEMDVGGKQQPESVGKKQRQTTMAPAAGKEQPTTDGGPSPSTLGLAAALIAPPPLPHQSASNLCNGKAKVGEKQQMMMMMPNGADECQNHNRRTPPTNRSRRSNTTMATFGNGTNNNHSDGKMPNGDAGTNNVIVVSSCRAIDVPRVARPSWTSARLPPLRAKVILLGESGVGKTSLVYAYKYGFPSVPSLSCRPTIGAHYSNFELNAMGGIVPVQLQLWDTAGQERFRSMVPMYLRNVGAAVLVYDICNRASFDEIDYWLKDVWRCCPPADDNPNEPKSNSPLLLLIGNKTDQHTQREVPTEEGIAKAMRCGARFFEVSAIDTAGVRGIFQSMAEQLAASRLPAAQHFDGSAQEVDEGTNLAAATDDDDVSSAQLLAAAALQQTSVIHLEGEGPLLLREFHELSALWKKCQQVNCCQAI